MSNTKTFKLKDDAREFQAGSSIGFGMSFGVQYYDRSTKQKEWTNYKVAIFSSNSGQIDFYRSALKSGSIVTVSTKEERIDSTKGRTAQDLALSY